MKILTTFSFQILFTFLFFFSINIDAQWESINGPEGCEGARLGDNTTHVYAGTSNGLYRSDDDGNSWNLVEIDGIDNYQIWNLIVKNDTILVRGSKNDVTGFHYVLFSSYDNGNNWNQLNHPNESDYALLEMAFKEETIFFGKNTYPDPLIYFSNDGGYNWQISEVQDSLTSLYDLFQFENGFISKGYNTTSVGWENKIYYSESGLDQWSDFSFNNLDTLTNFFVNGSLYFALQNNDTLFYCSKDQGQTWEVTDIPIAYVEDGNIVKKGNELFCFFNNNDVLKSNDEGLTWTAANINLDPDFWAPNNVIVRGYEFLGSIYGKGIVRGTTSFSPSNTGINGLTIWDINILNGDQLYAGNHKYTISQDSWEVDDNELSTGMVIQHNGQLIRANGDVSISSDQGNTWIDITPESINDRPFNEILIHEGTWYVFGSYTQFSSGFFDIARVKYSEDSGQTWNILDNAPFQIVEHEGILFTTSMDGVRRSLDNGQTWELINNGLDFSPSPTGGNYFTVKVFPVSNRLFMVLANWGDEQKFYVSDDNGTTWMHYNNFPPELDLLKRRITLVDIDGVLAVFSNHISGLFISLDNGTSWVSFNEGLRQWRINSLAVGSEHIYIGTYGQGVLRRSLEDLKFQPVSGFVYKDDNNNGVWDNNELPLPDVLVHGEGNTLQYTVSKQDGAYQLFANLTNPVTIQTHPPLNPDFYEVNPNSITISQPDSMINFGVYINENITDLEIDHVVTTAIRPGFNASFYINGKNNGAINQSGEIRWVVQDDFDLVSANPVPDQIIGDTLVWQFIDLAPLNNYPISFTLLGSTDLVLGEDIQNISFITTPTNDIDLENNSDTTHTIVVGSYDPNDKKVEPAGNLSPQQLQEGTPLHYTIRFQNTGTYLAETVKIVDFLDSRLNLTSLQIMSASHVYTYNLTTEGRLEFVFDMINLPDSTANEMDSHGFIKFSILPNHDIPLGEKITNFASIYFDFNDPIITNEVATEIALPVTHTFDLNQIKSATIYPNPTNGLCTILFNEDKTQPMQVYIYDLNGRLLRQIEMFSNKSNELDLNQYQEGIYLIRGVSESNSFLGKIILMKE